MVGDATSRYVHSHPSLCEVVHETVDNKTNITLDCETVEKNVIMLDLADCPKALEVVFAITFTTGLIMVRLQ